MDPLSPSKINPSWSNAPTTPSRTVTPSAQSPLPTSPLPASASSSSFREPKVFGAPGLGLVNPPSESSQASQAVDVNKTMSTAKTQERQGSYLRVRIGGLERNRKDLLIRFDASTNLAHFRTTLYRNMQRSYVEFQRFAEQASLTTPQTIIPALPLATTSAVTDEEDDRLVRIALQRWFTRVCEDPVLLRDDEVRAFIESDFGYQPIPLPSARRPASASTSATNVLTAALSKVVRRGPLDEDDELASAKGALEKLEGGWGGAAAAVGAVGKARRAHALAGTDVGSKLISLSTVESDLQLGNAERKFGRVLEQLAGMAGAQAASENVVLSDSLGYQALNARAAKDALLQRTEILDDSQTATKNAINKRRNVERLKGSSSINPNKVDDAISEMNEANALETQLTSRLEAISKNLHVALRAHSRQAHEDVALALLEIARLTVGFHKHTLRELEALRPDITRVGDSGAASTPVSTASPFQPRVMPDVPLTMGGTSTRVVQTPPTAPPMDRSKSKFLPRTQTPIPRPSSAGPQQRQQSPQTQQPQPPHTDFDPLGGRMAQSMMLPGQAEGHPGQRAQTMGRASARRLDERKAAKLLAGGF